jgi:hypothetical protein
LRNTGKLPGKEEIQKRPTQKFYWFIEDIQEGDCRSFIQDPDEIERKIELTD